MPPVLSHIEEVKLCQVAEQVFKLGSKGGGKCRSIIGVTYTRVVVYLRRTLEGPFLHLFFWGVLKLFCVHLFGGFLWPEIFPRNFYPQKIKKKFF